MGQLLQVKRIYLPIGRHDNQWEQYPYERVVWASVSGVTTVRPDRCPDDFARGLLKCYIDGKQVDPGEFDEALGVLSPVCTRRDIEKAIKP